MLDTGNDGNATEARAPRPHKAEADDAAHAISDRPVVLVVDDVEDNLLALAGMLRRDDIEIVTASSGRAALEVLLERDVALAIVDVHMPEMDGFALADLMRGVDKTRYVPLIFVTAGLHDVSGVSKGYEAGAVDFLFKPVNDQVLRSKVAVFVMLHRQRQQLIQAERIRELFVGVLGHDLRNPLNGILMSIQLAMLRTADTDVRLPLERSVLTAERMVRLVEQLLDVTRIRLGGGVSLSPGPADLGSLVGQVVEELAQHRRRFVIELAGATSGTWDIDRLAQVVSNLVGNAVQHSPPDTPILVRVNGAREETLVLEVRNSGPRIPPELQEVLFEPFRGRNRAGGLGLGLFVCKQFVAAHGGRIDFESSDEGGTCFRVSLPRHASPPIRLVKVLGDLTRKKTS